MPPIKSNFHRYDMENMIEADNVISYKKKRSDASNSMATFKRAQKHKTHRGKVKWTREKKFLFTHDINTLQLFMVVISTVFPTVLIIDVFTHPTK